MFSIVGFTFAQVGKQISEEWKEIDTDAVDKLKEEAEELNATNTKKLPKFTDSGEEIWSEEDDPSFDETAVKKPIIMKIKREEMQRSAGKT